MKSSSSGDIERTLEDLLVYDNLAFSTPRPRGSSFDGDDNDVKDVWVNASARAPFVYDSTHLNVEFFGDPSWPRILLFVHGVCESAETWTVQHLARICASRNWRMAVLELEGHGLSEGTRGLIGSSWSRCVKQVTAFCEHSLSIDRVQKRSASAGGPNRSTDELRRSRFVLAGASLGGALVAYASQSILEDGNWNDSFAGTFLLSPAVGVDPLVVPPPFVVACLSALSWVLPSVGIEGATPTEDPSHYNCPPWTNRNFSGAWPLGTSKMLLDVTSKRIPDNVASGKLNLLRPRATNEKALKHSILVLSGDKDPVVPIEAVRRFVDGMKTRGEELTPEQKTKDANSAAATERTIEIVEIKKGDHGLLAQSTEDPDIGKTQKKTTEATIDHVNSFLKLCEEMDTINTYEYH